MREAVTPLLSVESVSKDFHTRGKRVLALDSLSMTVDEGEFVTVVGPSGCGKSTLLNLIVGLLQVSSGHILFRNRPINGINPEIGYITLVVIVVFFLTFFNTYSGVKGVDIELKNILRIMGASERQILFKVTVPGTIPWITTGLKLSVPYALVGAVVGEFIAASKGLGYLINYNTSLFSTTGAFGGILVLALIVVLCNEIIERTEAHLLRWRPREEVKGGRELY